MGKLPAILRIFTACLAMGAMFGIIAANVRELGGSTGNSRGILLITSIDVRLGIPAVIGAFVGFLCSPFVVRLLLNRQRERAWTPILLITALGVMLTAWTVANLVLLMILSGMIFVGTCFLVAVQLPTISDRPGLCRTCGYDLRGSMESVKCPECGTDFDREQLAREVQSPLT